MTEQPAPEVLLAKDPATAPETLKALLSSTDPEVRRALAGNPGAPWGVLLPLIPEFPDAFWNNPALDLLLLEQPGLLARLPGAAALALASSRGMPGRLAPSLAEHRSGKVQAALGKNPVTPRELLEGTLRREVPLMVAQNPSISPGLLREFLGEMSDEPRRAAASNPSVPAEWRRRWSRLGLSGDLGALPDRWPPVFSEDLEWLAGEGPWFRACASLYPVFPAGWLPPETLPPPFRELTGLRLRYGGWLVEGLLARAKRQDPPQSREFLEDHGEFTWWLLAPSLRAPLRIERWLSSTHAAQGVPLVELRSQDTLLQVKAPVTGRVLPVFSGGQVRPGQPLARLLPDTPPTFQGRPIPLPELSLASFPAPVVVPMPPLNESANEASLQDWKVAPGDWIQVDQPLVTAGLDKCDIELQSPCAGIVLTRAEEQGIVAVGSPLMTILPLPRDRARTGER
jgi:biotin carboxyl carrier protein